MNTLACPCGWDEARLGDRRFAPDLHRPHLPGRCWLPLRDRDEKREIPALDRETSPSSLWELACATSSTGMRDSAVNLRPN